MVVFNRGVFPIVCCTKKKNKNIRANIIISVHGRQIYFVRSTNVDDGWFSNLFSSTQSMDTYWFQRGIIDFGTHVTCLFNQNSIFRIVYSVDQIIFISGWMEIRSNIERTGYRPGRVGKKKTRDRYWCNLRIIIINIHSPGSNGSSNYRKI